MRLAAAEPASTSGLEAAVGEVLDRRLQPNHARPVAVALSGGGDSLALLLTAAAWAQSTGRKLLVLTVDHRLQAAGAGWRPFASAKR